eukprot:c5_g1_i1.p1 GENE.c5_g1_i1~~c5_g1_i1.p1  ORF type:complete len:714 (+),score=184.96 c5_g1_i1:57-2198(+)
MLARAFLLIFLVSSGEAIRVTETIAFLATVRTALSYATNTQQIMRDELDSVVQFIQLSGDPQNITSVTEVKTPDGRVVASTTVVTEPQPDGTSKTTVIYNDAEGHSYQSSQKHAGDAIHSSLHRVDSGDNVGVVNVKSNFIMDVDGPDHSTDVDVNGGNIHDASVTPTPTPTSTDITPTFTPTITITPTPTFFDTPTPTPTPLPRVDVGAIIQNVLGRVDSFQTQADVMNMIWVVGVVLVLMSLAFLMRAMDVLELSGSLGWSFWTSCLILLCFSMFVSLTFVSYHFLAKKYVVKFANIAIGILKTIQKNMAYSSAPVSLSSHLAVQSSLQPKNMRTFQKGLENLCVSAFVDATVNSSRIRLSEDRMLSYLQEGPLEMWSPIARWNAMRTDNQKRIPNPSNCSNTMNYDECPGYIMFVEGRDYPCDCAEVMAKLGFDVDIDQLVVCGIALRDIAIGSKVSVRSDMDWSQATTSNCAGVYDASALVTSATSTLLLPYASGSFVDSSVFHDKFAEMKNGDELVWELPICNPSTLTVEFRYATATDTPIEITFDSNVVQLTDGSSIAKSTGGNGVFMRLNMIISPWVVSRGQHTVKIRVLPNANGSNILRIHRLNICESGSSQGCPNAATADSYCYAMKTFTTFADRLTTFEASAVGYDSLSQAMTACSSRQDCSGISETDNGKWGIFSGSSISSGSVTSYIRTAGTGIDGLCPNA